jgi:hypothetical protein
LLCLQKKLELFRLNKPKNFDLKLGTFFSYHPLLFHLNHVHNLNSK